MGDIAKITAKVQLPIPRGWDPSNGQFFLPFAIELKEDWHIHWGDIRIEMTSEDFEGFAIAMANAYKEWIKDGKPSTLDEMKRYATWPGEEGLDHFKKEDRNNPLTPANKTRFHFKSFPRTESGRLYTDHICQIELQKAGWFHIHYKNFRIELSRDQLKNLGEAMLDSATQND